MLVILQLRKSNSFNCPSNGNVAQSSTADDSENSNNDHQLRIPTTHHTALNHIIPLITFEWKLLPAKDKYSSDVLSKLRELYGALAKLFRASDRNLMGMYVVPVRLSYRRLSNLSKTVPSLLQLPDRSTKLLTRRE